ncbi:Antitoxin YefM [Candidatus Magnetomoraceae bacterium gMMP-15]
MQAMNISEAHKQLFKLRERVVEDHDQVIITHKNGNIVLISMDEWESYQETFRLLKDKAALRALLQSFEDREVGEARGKTVDEVFSEKDLLQ